VIGRQRRDWHVPMSTLRRHHLPGGHHLPWRRSVLIGTCQSRRCRPIIAQ